MKELDQKQWQVVSGGLVANNQFFNGGCVLENVVYSHEDWNWKRQNAHTQALNAASLVGLFSFAVGMKAIGYLGLVTGPAVITMAALAGCAACISYNICYCSSFYQFS